MNTMITNNSSNMPNLEIGMRTDGSWIQCDQSGMPKGPLYGQSPG
jgi:hypothetical protein